jgi:hypothetical protein
VPWVTRMEDGGLLAVSGPDMVALRTPVDCKQKISRQSGTSLYRPVK